MIIYFARSAEKILRFYFARSAEKILRFYFARSAEKILVLRKLKWLKRDKMKMNKYHVGEAAEGGGAGGGRV